MQSNVATKPAQITPNAKSAGQRNCNLPVVVTLVAELKHFSCNIGISACIANALAVIDGNIPNPNELANYSPRLSPELLEAIQTFRRLDPSSQMRQLDKLLRRQQATNVSSLEAAKRPPAAFRIATPMMAQLVTSWRANCKLALDALQEIETGCGKYGVRVATSDWWAPLCALLNEASEGSTSCVKADGQVVIPNFAERRKAERVAVHLSAEMSRPTGESTVSVRDISAEGLAMEGVDGIAAGDEVTVKLETGRTVTGTIRWVKSGNAGMEFAKPI